MSIDEKQGRWDLSFSMGFVDYSNAFKSFKFNPERSKKEIDDFQKIGLKWAMTGGINPLDGPEEAIKEIVRIGSQWFEDAGLKVSSYHMAGATYNTMERSQEHIVKNMLANVRLFAPFKPKAIVMHAGWIWLEPEDKVRLPDNMFQMFGHRETGRILHMHREQVEKYGEDAVIETAAKNLKIMAKEAAKYNICLAFENMGGMAPLGGFDTMGKLVDAVDEPNAGYCLDSGHAWMRGEKPEDWVHFMGKKLFETHFHDNHGGSRDNPVSNSQDEHLPVSFGTIDWSKVIYALDKIGFEGPVTFENDGWPLEDRVEGLKREIEWWRIAEKMWSCRRQMD